MPDTRLSRRTLASIGAGVAAIRLGLPIGAQAGTPIPNASPNAEDDGYRDLEADLLAVDPADLLALLRATPIENGRFPASYGKPEPIAWDDTGDSDLENAVGGVIIQSEVDDNDNPEGPGIFIVMRTAEATADRFAEFVDQQQDDSPTEREGEKIVETEIDGFPGLVMTSSFSDGTYATAVLRVGYVIVGGQDFPAVDTMDIDAKSEMALMNVSILLAHLSAVVAQA